jgi:signal transduction histidine kinase
VALAVVIFGPLAALVAYVFIQGQVDEQARARLIFFHVRTESLAREATYQLARIDGTSWLGPGVPGRAPATVEDAVFAVRQAVDEIVRLHAQFGGRSFENTVQRLRRQWGAFEQGYLQPAAAERATESAKALSIALTQLERLHQIDAAEDIEELGTGQAENVIRFALASLLVVIVSGTLGTRIFVLMRRSVEHEEEVEEVLRRSQERLAHAQRVESLGQLVGGVAHDFNNLLTSVLGHASLIAGGLDPKSELMDSVRQIESSGNKAAAITRQLLAFSREEVEQPVVLDLNKILQRMEPMVGQFMRKDIEMQSRHDPALGKVMADPVQIEQVVMNLALNARDAMPAGGTLIVETRNARRDASDVPEGLPAGVYSVVSVRDTGVGMDPVTASKVFEPFYTTKPVGKGTGLGLSVVHGIIAKANGYVSIRSTPGQGTEFLVHLPHVPEAAAEPLPEEQYHDGTSVETSRGSETILVAEDEEGVRRLVQRVLEMEGYQVLAAADGPEALEVCRSHDRAIDLILTDVLMPAMKGPEFVERALTLRPSAKVIYMSGYTAEPEFLDRVAEAGFPMVRKPFEPAWLVRRVRETLDRV